MKGKCTSCGFEGRLYWAKPNYQWCEACIAKAVVNTFAKFRCRPTRREVRQALAEVEAVVREGAAEVRALKARVAALESRVGSQAAQVSVAEQVRRLAEEHPAVTVREAMAATGAKRDTVGKALRRLRNATGHVPALSRFEGKGVKLLNGLTTPPKGEGPRPEQENNSTDGTTAPEREQDVPCVDAMVVAE